MWQALEVVCCCRDYSGMFDIRTILKIAIAAGLAWWFGNLAGQARPVFAALVPVVVIRSDSSATIVGAVGRVLGVLVGVGLGLAALSVARPSPVMVGVVVGAAGIVDRVVSKIPGVDTRSQAAVSALIMLFVANAVTSYAVARVWETAIGAGVALGVEWFDSTAWDRFAHRSTGGAR